MKIFLQMFKQKVILFFLCIIIWHPVYGLRDFSDELLVDLDNEVLASLSSTSIKSNFPLLQGADKESEKQLELELASFQPKKERPMVIVIPSYNNSAWYKENLDSVLQQNYKNYRVVYIDDCSPDSTGKLVEAYLKQLKQEHRVTLIKNEKRAGATANWYRAVHACKDNEIVVMVDGDDRLAHKNVLALLNKVYQKFGTWVTYGNFKKLVSEPSNKHHSAPVPVKVIKKNAIRQYPWVTSHLRTCCAWLFKRIKQEDFMHKGEYYPVLCDHAIMFPMIEMAGQRSKFIPDILLVYNNSSVINDHKIHNRMITKFARIIRSAPPYQLLTQRPR